jgi:hypothetical protein
MRDGGKGDRRRKLVVPEEQFNANWNAIFKKPEQEFFDKAKDVAKRLDELREGALNPALRTYDGKLK